MNQLLQAMSIEAERASQLHRRVELNIEIKQLETNLTDAIKQMV